MKRTILLTTAALFIFSSCVDFAFLPSVLDALLIGAPITSITFSMVFKEAANSPERRVVQ